MARKICDFNHISTELNREQIDELMGYYKAAHLKWFLYKKAHRHLQTDKICGSINIWYNSWRRNRFSNPFRFRFDYYISWCFIINQNFT